MNYGNKKIIQNVVNGGPGLRIPPHLSLGQHVVDCLRKICKQEDLVALIDSDTGEKTTYKQLLQETVDVATGLKRMGVKRGDVVALCGENKPEYLIAALAALCCGATVAAFNLMYTKEEMIHALNISKPILMFCTESALTEHLATLRGVGGVRQVVQLGGAAQAAAARGVPLLGTMAARGGDARAFEPEPADGCDGAFILYSSGTTGLPKGVMLSNLNVLSSLQLLEETDGERMSLISIMPWYHVYGLLSTISSIIVKCLLVYSSKTFDPLTYLRAIQEYQIRMLLIVPPIAVFLSKAPMVEEFDLSSVELVWCGAAPLSSETIAGAMKRLPKCTGIYQGYGMTETSFLTTKDMTDQNAPRKPGSAGYPIAGTKVKVVDIEKRVKLGPNQAGEICIKGPNIMKCYVGNEAATRDAIDEEGYLKTGDIGYYDVDGAIFIVDRLKELIKYKGNQVAPAAVESVVLQHGGVAECGVVGAPDEQAGELPTAFVVRKPGVQLTDAELLRFTAARLSPTSQLRGGVIFVDEIPKNTSGKILRRKLKEKLMTIKSKL